MDSQTEKNNLAIEALRNVYQPIDYLESILHNHYFECITSALSLVDDGIAKTVVFETPSFSYGFMEQVTLSGRVLYESREFRWLDPPAKFSKLDGIRILLSSIDIAEKAAETIGIKKTEDSTITPLNEFLKRMDYEET